MKEIDRRLLEGIQSLASCLALDTCSLRLSTFALLFDQWPEALQYLPKEGLHERMLPRKARSARRIQKIGWIRFHGRALRFEPLVKIVAQIVDVGALQTAIEPQRVGIRFQTGVKECRLMDRMLRLDQNSTQSEPIGVPLEGLACSHDDKLRRGLRVPRNRQRLLNTLRALDPWLPERVLSVLPEISQDQFPPVVGQNLPQTDQSLNLVTQVIVLRHPLCVIEFNRYQCSSSSRYANAPA